MSRPDLEKAADTLTRYLLDRHLLHATLDAQTETGVRGQHFTPGTRPAPENPDPDRYDQDYADPTGECASSGDRARRLRSELDGAEARIVEAVRALQSRPVPVLLDSRLPRLVRGLRASDHPAWPRSRAVIDHACQTLARIMVEVLDARPPSVEQRAKVENRNAVVCAFCGNEPPRHANPTTVNGNLAEPRWVGSSCYDRIRKTGRPPSRRDVEHLKRTGVWPKIREPAA